MLSFMKKSLCAVLFSFCLIINHGTLCTQESRCEAYFSQKDNMAENLVQLIDREQRSIKVAIYTLTHSKIVQALKRAKERGVDVEVIIDPSSITSRSPIYQLVKYKVPLFVWDPPPTTIGKSGKVKKALMHDKFCIFGEERVWTGSFNFTYSANTVNAENVLVIENSSIARKYLDHFNEVKIRSCRTFESYQGLYQRNLKNR